MAQVPLLVVRQRPDGQLEVEAPIPPRDILLLLLRLTEDVRFNLMMTALNGEQRIQAPPPGLVESLRKV